MPAISTFRFGTAAATLAHTSTNPMGTFPRTSGRRRASPSPTTQGPAPGAIGSRRSGVTRLVSVTTQRVWDERNRCFINPDPTCVIRGRGPGIGRQPDPGRAGHNAIQLAIVRMRKVRKIIRVIIPERKHDIGHVGQLRCDCRKQINRIELSDDGVWLYVDEKRREFPQPPHKPGSSVGPRQGAHDRSASTERNRPRGRSTFQYDRPHTNVLQQAQIVAVVATDVADDDKNDVKPELLEPACEVTPLPFGPARRKRRHREHDGPWIGRRAGC